MNDMTVIPLHAAATAGQRRALKIRILRYNPQEPGSVPHLQTYELEQAEGMTLFIALSEIREKLDPSLQFDFVCRAGICGTCTSRIISGEVDYFEDPLEDPAQGELLLCCSRPKSAIVLDL